ncbi:MAG: hypothetical protein KDD22_08210 [Bdellovibrionales bacterium]|nr:hypothetical protein [Bdellovibrionales bacterium]
MTTFQNCGQDVEFATQQSALKSEIEDPINDRSGDNDIVDEPQQPTPPPPKEPVPSPIPEPMPPVKEDPKDEVVFECKSYKAITTDDFVVPPKDSSGRCYYIKLMSKVSSHKSGTYGEKRTSNVLASNHNGNSKDYIAPFEMGDAQLRFSVVGPWKVALSSSYSDPTASMSIDNFFLLELDSKKGSHKWAYGTADAEPNPSAGKGVLVDNKPIDSFYAFANGGTAKVKAIGISSYLAQQEVVDFRFRGLDCGGSAVATDVYLVFH